jgi:hypothetical protein
MSTDNDQQKLEAKAWKYVNHASGAVMFFDSYLERWPKPRRTRAERICRVTLEEVKNEADLAGLGYRTRNTVIVELPTETFRSIRKQCMERELRDKPITFAFQLDQAGSLTSLDIDGKPIAPRVRRDSDVVPKEPRAPAGSAATSG